MQKSFPRRPKDKITWTAYPGNRASHVNVVNRPHEGHASAIRTSVSRVQIGRWCGQCLAPCALRLGNLGPRFAEGLEPPKPPFVKCPHIRRIAVIELFENVTHR